MPESKKTSLTASFAETSQGWIGVAARSETVVRVVIGRASESAAKSDLNASDAGSNRFTDQLVKRLVRLVEGEMIDLSDVSIDDANFTPFRRQISDACRNIPFGEVATYGELAKQAGRPKAARAVGRVMASNPFPLIVPCHRVVGAQGALTGFTAPRGVEFKQRLLEGESALVNA